MAPLNPREFKKSARKIFLFFRQIFVDSLSDLLFMLTFQIYLFVRWSGYHLHVFVFVVRHRRWRR